MNWCYGDKFLVLFLFLRPIIAMAVALSGGEGVKQERLVWIGDNMGTL